MPETNDPTPVTPTEMAPANEPADPNWKPLARTDIVFRQLADEWVLFDSESNQIHVMNLTAARVWLECDGTRTASAIAQELRADFDDPPAAATVHTDVLTALNDFVDRGLVA